ncbi:MAG TPA: succinate dehydrogenase, cytochrome b556 subunit [Gammaproteobacteria bacterium]|nr:succinate dehydrogenase, cytochrome b556 subunit [Gammaproteobacteria bacterium]
MSTTASRPRFLNLLLIRMPVGAAASIGHRISGIFLFLSIPLAAFLLDLSLQGPEGFTRAAEILSYTPIRALQVVIAWSFVQHVLAGIRFLLLDMDIGLNKSSARLSAWVVNCAAPVLAALLLWGVW